jgi:NAD(P)H-hydrate epimerase
LGQQRIAILCGKGNNGGDGMVIARQLWMEYRAPRVVLLADPASLRPEARINYHYLQGIGLEPYVVRDMNEWRAIKPELEDSTLLIDAILGTGLNTALDGFFLEIVSDMNTSLPGVPVVSVDMPSGLPSDTGDYVGESVRASLTITFTAPKVSQVFPPNMINCGDLVVAPIGTPPAIVERRSDFFLNLVEAQELKPLLAPRLREAHKGDFGHVLVAAGGRGKTGAAALTGQAALRSGAGLVTVATAESALASVAAHCAEIMTEPLPETEAGSVSARALEFDRFAGILKGKTVLAMGPGLSTHPDTVDFVRRVVHTFKLPMVLDADALNAVAGVPELLNGRDRVLVVTPHPGEMARLVGKSTSDVQSRRVETARALARAQNLYVVLKGFRTLVAEPGGQVYVNPTGNPGMASGGMGDVLTGLIAGFLAQFSDRPPEAAICAAVYLHGLAGDLAAAEVGEMPLVAGDVLRMFPAALRKVAG